VMVKQTAGGALFLWMFIGSGVTLMFPLTVWALVFDRRELDLTVLWFMLGSGCLHGAYFVLLQRGYKTGDLSLVYPLARGTGPLFATAGAIVLLGERPGVAALGGAFLIAVGIILLLGGPSATFRHAGPAIGFAVVTGILIGVYTVWDAHVVTRLDASPILYLWVGQTTLALLLTPVAWRHRSEIAKLWRASRREAVIGGTLSQFAYLLVLFALTLSPVSYVAPSREISILFGAVMGSRVLAEGHTRQRLAAAGAMVLGIVLLAIG
jgi:drug/metabolite transporter (DMT)-like permease